MNQLSLSANSTTLVSTLTKFIEEFCQTNDISSEVLNNSLLVIDEVVSNIKKYANSGDTSVNITCSMKSNSPRNLTLEIVDDGKQFNPLIESDPNLNAPIEERETGGLGIFLIKSLTTDQKYQWLDNANFLQVTIES